MTRARPGSLCDLGHPRRQGTVFCAGCRRDELLAVVSAVDPSLPAAQVVAAFDAVIAGPGQLRSLHAAVTAHGPGVLTVGAPTMVARLVTELVARGSTTLTLPACGGCDRSSGKLTWTPQGARCPSCRRRQTAQACATCHVVKPVVARTGGGAALCARCAPRPRRRCGACDRVRLIARRGRDGQPDICDSCFAPPTATCSRCGQRRPCNFASTAAPVCERCAPRRLSICARCGADRPAAAVWDEGPVCDHCYTAALRTRSQCQGCGKTRRLVHPPGASATTCADCAGIPTTHACVDCGIEDKLYERGRCDRCALRRRTHALLCDDHDIVRADLAAVAGAIVNAPVARSALNWLRNSAGAALLGDIASGRVDLTHDALDAHPRPRAADYLRRMLVAHQVLPDRDDDLARFQRWSTELVAAVDRPADRRLLTTYATWHVTHRLRGRAARTSAPRTPTATARHHLRAAAALLDWLADQQLSLTTIGQRDIDRWLLTGPGAYRARDFITWAADHRHVHDLTIPVIHAATGAAMSPDTRWQAARRLLHDDTLELTDRVAGSLVLLYAQQLTRITAMTTADIVRRADHVTIRLGPHSIDVPPPLAGLIVELIDAGRRRGIGAPLTSPLLFPGHQPGRPLTPSHLGRRLRTIGVPTMTGRRAALLDLAAQLPAAVLADLLGLHPTTAVNWVNNAAGDWNNYAAALIKDRTAST